MVFFLVTLLCPLSLVVYISWSTFFVHSSTMKTNTDQSDIRYKRRCESHVDVKKLDSICGYENFVSFGPEKETFSKQWKEKRDNADALHFFLVPL